MIKLYVKELLIFKGLKPTAYTLQKMGIPYQTGTRIINNEAKNLSLDLMEKLCIGLNCLPNDLLTYQDNPNKILGKEYSIHELKKPDNNLSIPEMLKHLSTKDLLETTQYIHETKVIGKNKP